MLASARPQAYRWVMLQALSASSTRVAQTSALVSCLPLLKGRSNKTLEQFKLTFGHLRHQKNIVLAFPGSQTQRRRPFQVPSPTKTLGERLIRTVSAGIMKPRPDYFSNLSLFHKLLYNHIHFFQLVVVQLLQ